MQKDFFHFKKKFGQNFLKDESIPRKIVEHASILEDSLVIEVGPGSGALTKILVQNAKQVLCYEIDTELEDVLAQQFIGYDNISIIYDDFLKRDVKEDLTRYSYSHLYLIANLPYYITTPIITKVIEDAIPVEKMVVMVQKEVAYRFSAKPGSKDYSSITVFLNYYYDIKNEFEVSRNCFIPKPNVDSMVVSFTRKKELLSVHNLPLFFQLVRDSFRYKRKMLRNNLKNYDLEKVSQVLERYHLDLKVRAEELSLEVFVAISNSLFS